jgi:hypothetical protein
MEVRVNAPAALSLENETPARVEQLLSEPKLGSGSLTAWLSRCSVVLRQSHPQQYGS